MEITTSKHSRSFRLQLNPKHPHEAQRHRPNHSIRKDMHISSTHRDSKPEDEPVFRSARYHQSRKPSIAYVDSEQDHDFIHSLGEYIQNINHDVRQEKGKQNKEAISILAEKYLVLEQTYKKEKMNNGMLAKRIYSQRKKFQENEKVISGLEEKVNNLIREGERLRFQNRQEEQKNKELKGLVVRKDLMREAQGAKLYERYTLDLEQLEDEKEQFEKMMRSNEAFYK